jgi:phosphoserine phosphatase RsbU/P
VPIVMHRDGTCDRPAEGGGVLGVFELQTYVMGVQELAPGDRVVFFTDGVTEASGPDEEEFGEKRLLRLLQDNRDARAEDLQGMILKLVGEYCGGVWNDDATLIVVEVE